MSPGSVMSPMSPAGTHRTIDRMGSTVHSFSSFAATQQDTLKKSRSESSYHLDLVHKRRARRAELVHRILEEPVRESVVDLGCAKCAEYKADGQDSIRLLTLENEHLRRGIGCLLQVCEAMLSEERFRELRTNLHLNVRYLTGFGVEEFEALGDAEILTKGIQAEMGKKKASRMSAAEIPKPSVHISPKKEPEEEEQPAPTPNKRRLLGARDRTGPAQPEDKMIQCNLLEEHAPSVEPPVHPAVASQPSSPAVQKTPAPAKEKTPATPVKEKAPAKEKNTAPPSPKADTGGVVDVSDTLKIRKDRRARVGTPLGARGSSSGSIDRTASPLADPSLHQVQGLGDDIPPHRASLTSPTVSSPPMSSHSQRLASPPITRVRAKKEDEPPNAPSMDVVAEKTQVAEPLKENMQASKQGERVSPDSETKPRRTLVGAGPSLGASRSRAPRASAAAAGEDKGTFDFQEPILEKPDVVDRCVGGGPGPGLADLASEADKITESPTLLKMPRRGSTLDEEMNKNKHMYDRKLRTGPRMSLMPGAPPAGDSGPLGGPRKSMATTGSWEQSRSSILASAAVSAGTSSELAEDKTDRHRRGSMMPPKRQTTKSAAQLAAGMQLQRLAEADEKYQEFIEEQEIAVPSVRHKRASIVAFSG